MTAAPFNWRGATVGILDAHRQDDILRELDAACLKDGQLQVMPSSFYAQWSRNDLAVWCVHRGFYCLPTDELVNFLRNQIGDADAIEIGAGNGALGRALGIPVTDSRQQDREDVRELYVGKMGQAVVPYGDDVEKLTGLEAVEKYQPRVVVAAWVTHRFNPQRPRARGNMNGVDEGRLVQKKSVRKYIFVGHTRVHELKPILFLPHATHRLPYIHSRAFDAGDVVWVWSRR